jgi:hypothetical protein
MITERLPGDSAVRRRLRALLWQRRTVDLAREKAAAALRRMTAAAVKLQAVTWAFVVWAVVVVTLFVCYLHVASSTPVTSDGASNALQAWDMLHGNLLLRGWQLSDVSFYTTELPQYMLIERVLGLRPEVVHVAGAMTYTLLVLLAAQAAKGKASGRTAMLRCLIAAGIMLAPQVGNGIAVLMGSPDHVGSTVPVLAVFVLIDRAERRWFVPVVTGVAFALALIADSIVMYTGVLPVIGVCLVAVYHARFRQAVRASWRGCWFEFAMAGAALGAVPAASVALHLIRESGGFMVWPLPAALAAPAEVPQYLMTTGRGLLLLFGANFFSHNAGLVAALAAAHLTGLAMAIVAACLVIRNWSGLEFAARLLAAGIVILLAAFSLGTRADSLLSARDIAAVLPFGAALAGRMLAERLARARLLPALAVLLAAYLYSLGRIVTLPQAPAAGADLAPWLAAHHLDYGLAGYWNANVTTLDTGGTVTLRSVLANGSQITGDYWEVQSGWYDPAAYDANFIVLVPAPPGFRRYPTVGSVRATFGQPSRIYDVGTYTVIVYDKNLLSYLRKGAPLPPRAAPSGPAPAPLPGPDRLQGS